MGCKRAYLSTSAAKFHFLQVVGEVLHVLYRETEGIVGKSKKTFATQQDAHTRELAGKRYTGRGITQRGSHRQGRHGDAQASKHT